MKIRMTIASLFAMSILSAGVAYADATAYGTATINVTAPSENALSLENEPSFDFGIVKNTVDLEFITTAASKYRVLDLRGQSNASYEIQAEITDFTATKSKSVLPVIQFLISIGDSTDGQLKGSTDVDIFKTAGKIASGVTGKSKSEESGDVTAKLVLKSSKDIEPNDKYTATITHRIVSGVE